MMHYDSIEEFHLATNVNKIGTFDDICFKAKLKGLDKSLAVFIQAKHKENDKQTLKNDLAKYFESYMQIRRAFKSNSKSVLFEKFEETDCLFVLYTTAKDDFGNALFESSFASKLYDLIGTGGIAKQPFKNEEDVEFLCKIAIKEEIISLAGRMTKFVFDDDNFQMLLKDEVTSRYHVILAQKVFEVSEIQPEGHRIASFRQSFFDTNEEILILLKDTLYIKILKGRKLNKNEMEKLLSEFFKNPSNVEILSELIGTIIKYNNGQLEFFNNVSTEENFKLQLDDVYVSKATVNQAVELAAKGILASRRFKVPIAFGNKDLTIRGNDVKVEGRLDHLASKILDLFDNSNPNNIVTIDESLEEGFLQLNGGIAGAVGNILIPDKNTKLMKITDNCKVLGDLAKRLYEKLERGIHDLQEYKFNLIVKNFPKLSLDGSAYDQSLAKDFFNKLIFYTNQADETFVEEMLKTEIENYQCKHVNNFQVRTDAIFLKYHDEIQKWWMMPKQASYLSKESELFKNAINNIVKEPLMSIINAVYLDKIKHINYTFNEDALTFLKLKDKHSRTVIITEGNALTVVKVIQCLKNKDHVVLDLEYILSLPTNDHSALRTELINAEKILIFVCDTIKNSKQEYSSLEYFSKAVHNKNIIMITNQMSVGIINKYFAHSDNVVYDENNNLNGMSEESKESILKSTRVIFQGIEVSLDLILDHESLACVKEEVLNKIISKETIAVGKAIGNSNYDNIKHLYVDRSVRLNRYDSKVLKTLNDINNNVVIITATPGMGKSSLLTHLSLKTKEINPEVWILRINLLEYSKEFSKWKECETVVGLLETLNFICQVILQERLGKENRVNVVLEEVHGDVHLKECTGDRWTVFELKLFLHFYNRKKLVILFDGFDEICPYYTSVVVKCLKTVSNWSQRHIMWVTSRSYNEVKSILKQEFGTPYELEPFSDKQKQKYLEKFWKSNLILKDFDSKQLKNVQEFIEYVTKRRDCSGRYEFSLHDIYFNACYYLLNEINHTHLIPSWPYYAKYADLIRRIEEKAFLSRTSINRENKIPLHVYLIADYFQNKIKDVTKKTDIWSVDNNTFIFYRRFIETKLKKIRFQDKNKMDIYKPDVMMSYDKELADLLSKHKKLGAYAIFYQYSDCLFDMKELKEIKDTIKLIEKEGEKTGLIHSVADDIPIFIHMTFTEYFAVEYICDLLKSENSGRKQQKLMDFVFNVMSDFDNVKNIFDYKMQTDMALKRVIRTLRPVNKE